MIDIMLRDSHENVRGFRTDQDLIFTVHGITVSVTGFWTNDSVTLSEAEGKYFIPYANIAYINLE